MCILLLYRVHGLAYRCWLAACRRDAPQLISVCKKEASL